MNNEILKKIDAFFTQFIHQTYKKRQILIRADDNPAGVFYLKKGMVRQFAITQKGDELVVNIFKPSSFFPMSWAMNDTPNMYYFEAMTEVKIWRAPKEKAIEFIKQNPDVLYDLLSRVYKGTDGMQAFMTYLMAGNAHVKLISEILIFAKRFGEPYLELPKKLEDEHMIKIQVTEKSLAALSGITRETVSREVKTLKEKGLITFSKNVLVVNNIQKLEAELRKY